MNKNIPQQNPKRTTSPALLILVVPGAVLLASFILLFAVGDSSAERTYDQDIQGDLVIEENENRTFSDESILLSGDLTLEENASLTFSNVTFHFNSTADSLRELYVMTNGSFFCYDSTITVENETHAFKFIVNGQLVMDNSMISRLFSGITILSALNESVIMNSSISDSDQGMYILSDAAVLNCTFSNLGKGIHSLPFYFQGTSIRIRGNTFLYDGEELGMEQSQLRPNIQMLYAEDDLVIVEDNDFTGPVILDGSGYEVRNNTFTGYANFYPSGENMLIEKNSLSPEVFYENIWKLTNSTILDNIFQNEDFIFLGLTGSGGNLFRNNHFISDMTYFGLDGKEFSDFDNDIELTNNVNGKPIFYLYNMTGVEINSDDDPSMVLAVGCRDLYIHNITFDSASLGVSLYGTTDSRIENISSEPSPSLFGPYGICVFEQSDNNTLSDSLISHLKLDDSHNNTLDNVVFDGSGAIEDTHGLELSRSHDNLIRNCVSLSHRVGIWVYESGHNTIRGSRVEDNEEGIFFRSSHNNTIMDNTITGNERGIKVFGLSPDNTVYYNSITGNNESGMDALDNDGHTFDARYNWWGHESGPFHPLKNPTGTGDSVTDLVDFDPWLEEEGSTGSDDDGENDDLSSSGMLRDSLLGLGVFLAGSTLVLGYAVRGSEALRYQFLRSLLPLYTRLNEKTIERDIRQQNIRGRIFQHIKENPGTNFTKVLKQVTSGYGTTIYHLMVLQREGYIRSAVQGNLKVFWTKKEFPGVESAVLGRIEKMIIALLVKNGEMSRTDLLEKMDVSKSTLHEHIKNLEELGKVTEVKRGRANFCSLRME